MYILRYLALEASAVLLLIPAYFVLNKYWLHNGRKAVLLWLFSCYLGCMYALVGLPNVTYIRFAPNLNWIPLMGMVKDLKNCLLNIALFVPLGFLLPLLSSAFRSAGATVCTGFAASLAIECLQIFSGRTSDVNDLITNTVGTLLGFCLVRICVKNRPVVYGTKRELALVTTICAGAMFFLQPILTGFLWMCIL